MQCPKCGFLFQLPIRRQLGKLLWLAASMLVAIGGQAELLGEPWRHYVTVLAICSTAYLGVLVKHRASTEGE